ncbi:hypothetical protein FA13DRAFT_1739249 [Coprinellus micaceus]|uniref:Uncharacterized protein n=1 Tax=Coprinellus micaceus TaxID=71717 RepID=A0A4Y7SRA1_COPMI|nr:hypothetical protein FA13DRAFT_1739249 [Coprinellus micaceus]
MVRRCAHCGTNLLLGLAPPFLAPKICHPISSPSLTTHLPLPSWIRGFKDKANVPSPGPRLSESPRDGSTSWAANLLSNSVLSRESPRDANVLPIAIPSPASLHRDIDTGGDKFLSIARLSRPLCLLAPQDETSTFCPLCRLGMQDMTYSPARLLALRCRSRTALSSQCPYDLLSQELQVCLLEMVMGPSVCSHCLQKVSQENILRGGSGSSYSLYRDPW